MGRKLATYKSEINNSYCEVHFDFKEELAYIKYFDDNGYQFFLEEYPNATLGYVHDIAQNWSYGIVKKEKTNENVRV